MDESINFYLHIFNLQDKLGLDISLDIKQIVKYEVIQLYFYHIISY